MSKYAQNLKRETTPEEQRSNLIALLSQLTDDECREVIRRCNEALKMEVST